MRAANEKEVVRGYSPAQHALGRAPDGLGRFHDQGPQAVPEGSCENAQAKFKRNIERVRTAEKAFVDHVYNERLVRAQNSKGKPMEVYTPGELVYYWRYQAKGKGKGGASARVLAMEGKRQRDSFVLEG